MRYFKLAVTMLLVVAFATSTALAGKGTGDVGSKKAISRPAVSADIEQPEMKSIQLEKGERFVPFARPLPSLSPNAAPISGVKRIGVGKDYTSIASALLALMINGVGGPTTLYFSDASYTEGSIYLGAVTGASATNTITFKPDSNVAVTINLTDDGGAPGGGWTFIGSQFVTIDGTKKNGTPGSRDLTIQIDNAQFIVSSSSGTLLLRDQCSDMTIKNCIVKGKLSSTFGTRAIKVWGPPNKNITVDNCALGRARVGFDSDNDFSAYDSNIVVTNNDIGETFFTPGEQCATEGIQLGYAENCDISYNTVDGVRYPSTFAATGSIRVSGIRTRYVRNTNIHHNIVRNILFDKTTMNGTHGRAYGMRLDGETPNISPSANRIYNNGISEVWSKRAFSGIINSYGIQVSSGTFDTVYHNSVYFTGPAYATGRVVGIVPFGNLATYGAQTVVMNNAFKIDRTGIGSNDNTPLAPFALDIGGEPEMVSDYNVCYSSTGTPTAVGSLYNWFTLTGNDEHSTDNDPEFLSVSDLHVDTTVASAAEGIGIPTTVTDDIDGQPRATDAGFDEFTGIAITLDAQALAITGLDPSGIPINLPATPKGLIRNNAGVGVAAFNVNILVQDEFSVTVLNETKSSGAMTAWETKEITFSSFTPTTNGPYTATLTTLLVGDVNASNDTVAMSQPIIPLLVVDPISGYCQSWNDGGAHNWVAAGLDATYAPIGGDFQLLTGFSKLGGPYGGASNYSWVTEDGHNSYTEKQINYLLSPFFNLSGFTGDVYLSFFHSIKLEPAWDRSLMQYTTDGTTWNALGTLNDPNGVNWYSEAVYANAAGNADCYYDAYFVPAGFPLQPAWASNGDCEGADVSTGPYGWVYQRIKLPAGIAHSGFIRFRYVALSDYSSEEGWAFDEFCLSGTAATFTGTISGTKYLDVNGSNTIDGGDTPESGIQIDLKYFGVHMLYDTTDGSGNYSFNTALPGTYQVVPVVTGMVTNVPASGYYEINHPATGGDSTGKNFANYVGYVSGMKFNDLDDDGLKDVGEPGLSGWTIKLFKDSVTTGVLVGSAVTGAGGTYTIYAPPYAGNYELVEVVQSTTARQTYPATGKHVITISGPSGGGGAIVTGKDFGNFIYGNLFALVTVDLNGDGVKNVGDVLPLPSGVSAQFEYEVNGTVVDTFEVGNTVLSVQFANLDTGVYTIRRIGIPAGWIQTTANSEFTWDLRTSSVYDTAGYMMFKLSTASGHAFHDQNGNGTQDGAEPDLVGKTMNMTGTGGGSVVTNGDGDWTFTDVYPGSHTISLTLDPGFTTTVPAGNAFTFAIGNCLLPGPSDVMFGTFKCAQISGTKYRDRDNDGVRDAGDEGIAGWKIYLADYVGLLDSTITNADGDYSFCFVPARTDSITISEELQAGYTVTEPVGGVYGLVVASEGVYTGYDFGNYKVADSAQYRTASAVGSWWADQACTKQKVNKPAKVGKTPDPVKNAPTSWNLFSKIGPVQVGVAGADIKKGQPFLLGKKYKDVITTLCVKGTKHTGDPRGFDLDMKGKPILGQKKNMSPLKYKNSTLIAELVGLQLNLAMSELGITPAGLGDLKYYDPGNPLDGMTIYEIAAEADTAMSLWGGVGYDTYEMFDSVVHKINGAFDIGALTFDFDVFNAGGLGTMLVEGPHKWIGDVPFLHANPGATPKTRKAEPLAVPDVFALGQNYPNPFNPTTYVTFDLPDAAVVTLKVYNMLGQEVATLIDHELYDGATSEEISFDADNLASGVYLYRIVAESMNDDGNATGDVFTQVKKMVLLK